MTTPQHQHANRVSADAVDIASLLNEWRQLNLSIKAQPDHYQQHSKRIMFALQSGLNKFLPGALQDLFIALGPKGRSLRSQMYKLVLPLLDQNDREYFHEWLAHDSDSTLPCYRFPGAVLVSTDCLPGETESDPYLPKQSGSLIDRSRHAVDFGRIEAAQAQLEHAFTTSTSKPDNSLIEETLGLYAATRQRDKLNAFASSLQQQGYKLSNRWKQVLESSKEW